MPSPGAGQDKELLVDLRKTDTTSTSEIHVLGKCDPEVRACFSFSTLTAVSCPFLSYFICLVAPVVA